jgi:hypothetical protein
VLTSELRDVILEVFSEEVGLSDYRFISRKEVSKRWPIS